MDSERAYRFGLAGGGVLLAGAQAWHTTLGADYSTDAGPALSAAAHGHLAAFFAHQPAMGPLSLVWRAPFVALAAGLGDGRVGLYRWGCFACLLGLAVAAVWLAGFARRRGASALGGALIVALCLGNPLVGDALYWGHPEELLTAALAMAALLAALDRRALLAGLLAGLAVAGKQWAVLVLVPVVVLLPAGRRRTASLAAAGAAGVAWLPMVLADPGAFGHALRYVSHPQPIVTPFNWLYPFSPIRLITVANIFGDARTFQGHALLGAETWLRPAIVVAGALLVLHVARRRGGSESVLIATTLAFLLRCAVDPGTMGYYHLPLLLILVVLDAVEGRWVPVGGLLGTGFAFVVLDRASSYLAPPAINALYIAATVIVAAVLLARLSARRRAVAAAPPLVARTA